MTAFTQIRYVCLLAILMTAIGCGKSESESKALELIEQARQTEDNTEAMRLLCGWHTFHLGKFGIDMIWTILKWLAIGIGSIFGLVLGSILVMFVLYYAILSPFYLWHVFVGGPLESKRLRLQKERDDREDEEQRRKNNEREERGSPTKCWFCGAVEKCVVESQVYEDVCNRHTWRCDSCRKSEEERDARVEAARGWESDRQAPTNYHSEGRCGGCGERYCICD